MSLTPDELKKLRDDVFDNHRKLEECRGPHEFEAIPSISSRPPRYRCKKCGGETDSIYRHWYLAGLKHGVEFPERAAELVREGGK